MNIFSKKGRITKVKLIAAETRYLESAQGICRVIANNLGGDRAGELAATAEKALDELRDILAAEPVALVSK